MLAEIERPLIELPLHSDDRQPTNQAATNAHRPGTPRSGGASSVWHART